MKEKIRYRNVDEEALVEVSKQFGVPLSVSSTICHSVWKKLKELQSTGSFKTLFLPGFGKFYVKKGMRERIEQWNTLKKGSIIAKEINKDQQQLDY